MGDSDGKASPSPNPPNSSTKAAERLTQVSNHVSASNPQNTSRRRRRKSAESSLPADYSDILGQVSTLQKIAATPDSNNRGYVKQKQAGKLWVRERVEQFLDPGSLKEVGSVAGTVKWRKTGEMREEPVDYIPSNNIQGFGKIRGRTILFTADDFSIRAGHADGAIHQKTMYIEQLALALKLPMIKLVDGSSGGGSVTTIKTSGFSYVPMTLAFHPAVKQLNMGIPNLGMVLGPAIGYGAARVVACHFSVMAADIGSLFNAGPNVVANATFEEGLSMTELGGPSMHCTNGTIDNMAPNEAGCFEQIRTVLSYLPNHGGEVPPTITSSDPADRQSPDLRTVIPRRKERMYEARKIITTIVDASSWFEIGALWGTTAICGLARIGGKPCGIISNNCEVNGGAIDAAGSQKLARHLKFCDVFNVPVAQFVDIPGYAIGTVAERTATMRHGVSLLMAYNATTMPVFSVITRRCFGVAGAVMVGCREPRMCIAWPSGEWGSLPLAGGIEVGHSHELKTLAKEKGVEAMKERYRELNEEYSRLSNPVRTANAFGIEEIVDPAVTRPVLAEWLRHTYESLLPQRIAERMAGKIQPMFS